MKKETRQRLLAAYADGLEIDLLIERFGLTADHINTIARRAGVRRPAPPKEEARGGR